MNPLIVLGLSGTEKALFVLVQFVELTWKVSEMLLRSLISGFDRLPFHSQEIELVGVNRSADSVSI